MSHEESIPETADAEGADVGSGDREEAASSVAVDFGPPVAGTGVEIVACQLGSSM